MWKMKLVDILLTGYEDLRPIDPCFCLYESVEVSSEACRFDRRFSTTIRVDNKI